jgi:hypothetical protein
MTAFFDFVKTAIPLSLLIHRLRDERLPKGTRFVPNR